MKLYQPKNNIEDVMKNLFNIDLKKERLNIRRHHAENFSKKVRKNNDRAN